VSVLVRLILIPIGYIAAVFAASALVAGIEWLRAYPPVANDPAALGLTSLVVFTDFLFVYALIIYAAFVPSLIAVAVAEILSLRNALYFCGAGLFVAFAVSRLIDPSISEAIPKDPAVAAAAGLAGGLGYWISSGRWSGLKRRAEPAPG
jgi:hypothetical protein